MFDKIDEWLKKEFSNKSPGENTTSNKDHSQSKKPFEKGVNNNNNSNNNNQSHANKKHGEKLMYKNKSKTSGNQNGRPQNNQHGKPYRHNNQNGKSRPPAKFQQGVHKSAPDEVIKQVFPKMEMGKLRIIPLGGLNEVGKNMTVIEYEEDIIIIDVGFQFPGEELPGINYIVPDVSYLEENKKRIKGIFLTHGHLDHIGGLPYILPKLGYPPIYGLPLTLGLVEDRVKEFKQEKLAKLIKINADEKIRAGKFLCSFARVMHSIPDCVSIFVDTPIGKIVFSGDFKFDENPARNMVKADIHKFEALKDQNILLFLCESTNSIKPGHTISEKEVGEALDKVVGEAKDRIIVSSFSSQIGRVQQIIDAAAKHNRKVFVSGRSMTNNIETAARLGYLNFPKELVRDIKRYKNSKTPDSQTLILTTGSQGEPVAALARIARKEHANIQAKKGDTIMFSSSPIIGNEHAINQLVNAFSIMGCLVINNQMADIHTSGHGKQDELIRMINYVNPKYLLPMHGEFYMRRTLGDLAVKHCNIPESNIIMLNNGSIATATPGLVIKDKAEIVVHDTLIDGHGEGKIDSYVISDRKAMAQNGVAVIMLYVSGKNKALKGSPEIISRGFLYTHESEAVADEISHLAREAYGNIRKKNPNCSRNEIKNYIREVVKRYAIKEWDRTPVILPVIVDR